VFVTVKGGVYTANPEVDASAKLVPKINARRRFRIGGKSSGPSKNGTGGMQSKVNQASICARRGMRAGITGSKEILQFIEGETVGTKVTI
jgi:glutamate 5-kinase